MMQIRYAPGDGKTWGVAAAGRLVVVAGPVTPSLIAKVHGALRDGADLARVIDAFTGVLGASLHSLPSFAAVFPEENGLRVAVRGAIVVEVDVDADAAPHRLSGAGVSTWSELLIPDAVRARVAAGHEDAPAYPLADGAAPVAGVLLERDRTGSLLAARGVLPEVVLPEVAQPEVVLPEVVLPEVVLPEVAQPEVAQPEARAEGAWSRLAAGIPVPDLRPEPAPGASLDTLLPGETTALPAGDTSIPITEVGPATTGYDELWGETVLRSVEDAAVRPDEESGSAVESPPSSAAGAPEARSDQHGDHDGQTVSAARLRALRGESAPVAGVPSAVRDAAGAPAHPPLAAPRPAAPGMLRVSDGQSVLLDRTVIVGRRPRSTRVAGTDLPHLVAVDSPQQDISRSHVEFRVEGDSILATDLHTTNGTMLVRPGAAPTRLHPGEATVTVPGDVIDLGDGITVTVEAVS